MMKIMVMMKNLNWNEKDKKMKKILFILCSLFLILTSAQAAEAPSTAFVHQLADEIITNVLTSQDTQAQKTERFEKYFLKALDTQTIGKFVLGRYWRTASPEERNNFIDAFTDMALKSWADKFNLYTGQQITFLGEQPAEGKNQVYVISQIQNEPNPAEVLWRVQEKNGSYQIVDIIIEGVSMVLSYRNEYTSFLKDHKLPELTKKLQEQADSFTSSIK